MANRNLCKSLGSIDRGMVHMQGSVTIAADASVTTSSVKGATVTKTGTGEYTITLDDKWTGLLSAQLTLQAATAVDLVPQLKSSDVVSAKTVVFRTLAGAVATDASAVCVVFIKLVLHNSAV